MSSSMLAGSFNNARGVLISYFPSLCPNAPHDTPDEIKLAAVKSALDGSNGRFRNPQRYLSLITADNDYEAILTWLDDAGKKSSATRRSYEKEALRLLLWAVIEHGKPLSSLNIEDLNSYEKFLKEPVSRHSDYAWVSTAEINPETKRSRRGRCERSNPEWRPFDGPLSQRSVEYAMQVLKAMFSYWTDVGYTLVNPLKKRRKTYQPNKKAVLDRVLSPSTWKFLYAFLEQAELRIPTDIPNAERISLLRQANQRYMIFSALYLLGLRISELANLKMSDFSREELSNGTLQFWVDVNGKGQKNRRIPVPFDLIKVVSVYRENINNFPVVARRGKSKSLNGDFAPIKTTFSRDDHSALVLSASGSKSLTASRLAMIVKETMRDVKEYYESLKNPDPAIDPDQLEKASAHWLRHTSATHQDLKGVSLRYIKDFLGHANYDTTLIYSHADREMWAKEIEKFNLK